jgi:hypothetical protein
MWKALPAKMTYTEASMKNQGHPITFSEYNYTFIVLSKFGILMVQLLQKLSWRQFMYDYNK